MPSASDDLARTRVLFEQWRATRQGRSKIPDELWQAAVALHGRYSASQLYHELRLSAGALRSRLPKTVPAKSSALPAFVPLCTESFPWSAPTVSTASAEEIRLVWERADGARLHLCLPPSQWAQAEALCTAFWRS
ncbi:MAG: hypothetical protein JO185_20635 [Acidobacteriaceae bacterium]|nr:hypothetical protein [Acidobacteriaceae bacterium]